VKDQVLAVDGELAAPHTIGRQLRGPDSHGSPVRIRVRKVVATRVGHGTR
jgi:hypothetical protein